MAFKLALASESHWRKVNAPHLVALVRAGVCYQDGVHVSIPDAREQVEQILKGSPPEMASSTTFDNISG